MFIRKKTGPRWIKYSKLIQKHMYTSIYSITTSFCFFRKPKDFDKYPQLQTLGGSGSIKQVQIHQVQIISYSNIQMVSKRCLNESSTICSVTFVVNLGHRKTGQYISPQTVQDSYPSSQLATLSPICNCWYSIDEHVCIVYRITYMYNNIQYIYICIYTNDYMQQMSCICV